MLLTYVLNQKMEIKIWLCGSGDAGPAPGCLWGHTGVVSRPLHLRTAPPHRLRHCRCGRGSGCDAGSAWVWALPPLPASLPLPTPVRFRVCHVLRLSVALRRSFALIDVTTAIPAGQWELGDRGRWVVARVGAHQLVRALRWSHPAVLPQVLPAIAHLSTSSKYYTHGAHS